MRSFAEAKQHYHDAVAMSDKTANAITTLHNTPSNQQNNTTKTRRRANTIIRTGLHKFAQHPNALTHLNIAHRPYVTRHVLHNTSKQSHKHVFVLHQTDMTERHWINHVITVFIFLDGRGQHLDGNMADATSFSYIYKFTKCFGPRQNKPLIRACY